VLGASRGSNDYGARRGGHAFRSPLRGAGLVSEHFGFGPDETWPQHQEKFWNTALAEARRAGWTLTYYPSGHSFGVVTCPGGQHTFRVDKTARGGETKSIEARKSVRARCRCGSAEGDRKVQESQQECGRLLDTADELIVKADTGLTAAEAREDALEELERLELLLRSASLTIEDVEAEQAAWGTICRYDGAPGPRLIASDLDEAEANVDDAESVVDDLKAALARPLLIRVRAAANRIAALRTRLAALRERMDPDCS
jgi:hypothetical protein